MTARKLFRSIGTLESCFKEKFGTPRQPALVTASRAKLRVKAAFIPAQSLKGLAEFSHVWLLSYFHLNTNKIFLSTVHPPRLKGKTVGVFASRAPHRPSSIGLSLARLLAVDGDTLHLAEVDLVDGTPILDVKPYIPAYDSVPEASAGWTAGVASRELQVEFEPSALKEALRLEGPERPHLVRLIEQTLRQDMRNPRDKSQLKDGKRLAYFLYDTDVRYEVRDGVARVVELVPAETVKMAKKVAVPPELE